MAAAVVDPVSVPTRLGAREVLDLANPLLNLQKLEVPQVSVHQCAERYGSATIRRLFEKLDERKQLANWEEINLADNLIEDDGAEFLSIGLRGNPKCKRLFLPRSGLSAKGFQAMGHLLAENSAIENLILSGNICDAAGVQGEFSDGLAKNKAVKSLCIAACRIGDEGVAAICDKALCVHPTMEHLSLCYNRLEVGAAESLNKALAVNMALRYLDLSGNSLGPEGAEKLIEGLKANKGRLQKLGVAQNVIKLRGAKALAEFFISKEGKNLDYLDLRHNSVTYKGVIEVRKALGLPTEDWEEHWTLLFDKNRRQLFLSAH